MKILIIEDDRTVCRSMELLLGQQGYEVRSIHHPLNALEHIANFEPQAIILDMNFSVDTSGKQGLEALKNIRSTYSTPVILITGWGTMELAISGMKAGANDFITKPWQNQQILDAVQSVIHLNQQEQAVIDSSLDKIIGGSAEIQAVKKLIQKVAKTNATVLVTGESGTGKELVAEAIHDLSLRKKQNFVKVNLGGLSQTLFESELFGHKKGAFTGAVQDRIGRFELADKGTIFLDEIGEVPLDLQVKLLRVLQEKSFEPLGSSKSIRSDIRVISATHKPLEQMVQREEFREDLFYRLNIVQIHIPPLRERGEDIPLLANHFLQQLNQFNDRKPITISDDCIDWLKNQSFSGNIRQLKNLVERAYLLSNPNQKTLEIIDFKPHLQSQGRVDKSSLPKPGTMTLDEMEKGMILQAMSFHNGNVSLVAESLGLTRSSLYRRLEKYGIER